MQLRHVVTTPICFTNIFICNLDKSSRTKRWTESQAKRLPLETFQEMVSRLILSQTHEYFEHLKTLFFNFLKTFKQKSNHLLEESVEIFKLSKPKICCGKFFFLKKKGSKVAKQCQQYETISIINIMSV